jgi:hypothetical protein
MVATMTRVGGKQEIIPTPRPWMMTVAGPVFPDLEMDLTGAYAYEVQYSVRNPIRMPQRSPMSTQPKILQASLAL